MLQVIWFLHCRQTKWFHYWQPLIQGSHGSNVCLYVCILDRDCCVIQMKTQNTSRKYKGSRCYPRSILWLYDVIIFLDSRMLFIHSYWRQWGSKRISDQLVWGDIYSPAGPHLTFLHLHHWIYVGHSYWSSAFFLCESRFQVGSLYRAHTYVCQ